MKVYFNIFLYLLLLPAFIHNAAADNILTTMANPQFEKNNASIWQPNVSVAKKSFKEDIFNLTGQGTLNSVIGVNLSSTTATYRSEPTFICPRGTFASITVDDFTLGDLFTSPDINIDTKCYSCPEGYSHNPALPANIDGVCFTVTNFEKAILKQSAELFCSAGQFMSADFSGCYSCPSGYDHNPLLPVGVARVCSLNTTANKTRAIGCSGSEFDGLDGSCYTCPSDYSHNAGLSVATPGVCYKNTTANSAGGLNPLQCPSGYSFRPDSGKACARCTGDSSWQYQGLGKCGKNCTVGICSDYRDAKKADMTGGGCDAGEFVSGVSCYTCPSGYSHNSLLAAGTSGVCYKNTTASRRGSFSCTGTEFDGLEGNCYACDGGLEHNPLLSILTPGVCFKKTTASKTDEIQFICKSGEFYDIEAGICATCAEGYRHNPLLSARTAGVCYEQTDISADFHSDVELSGCNSGEFFDVISAKCYSCPAGTSWNPTSGVNDSGACVGLALTDRDSADFLAGMELDYDFQYRLGVNGGSIVDPGSVNINYQPEIHINVQAAGSPDSGHFKISTTHTAENSTLAMSSTFPSVKVYYDNYIDNHNKISARIYYPEFKDGHWQQGFTATEILDTSSYGEKNFASFMVNDPQIPLISFYAGVDGLEFSLVDFDLFDLFDLGFLGFQKPFDVDVTPSTFFNPPLEITKNSLLALAKKAKPTPPFVPTSSRILIELGVGTPDLNTPARVVPSYNGYYHEDKNLANNSYQTYIEQVINAGERGGMKIGVINDGLKDVDVLRTDIDIDGFASLANAVPLLGLKFSVPTPIPFVNLASLNLDAIDLDFGSVFHFSKNIRFEPNLEIQLIFSKPTQVETFPGSGRYEQVSRKNISAGDNLEFIHPGGALSIATNYILDKNQFINDTDFLLTPILQGEIISAKLKILGVPSDWPPKVTAVQLTAELSPEPIKLADISHYNQADLAVFSIPFDKVSGDTLKIDFGPLASCKDALLMINNKGIARLTPGSYYIGTTGLGSSVSFTPAEKTYDCSDIGRHIQTLLVTDAKGISDQCNIIVDIKDSFKHCQAADNGTNPEPGSPPVVDLQAGNLLAEIQNSSSITGTDNRLKFTENNITKHLLVSAGVIHYELKPIQVSPAAAGKKAGIYITADGLVELITDSGQQVVTLAEVQRPEELTTIFKNSGFIINHGAYGELFISNALTDNHSAVRYAARASYSSFPVVKQTDKRTGLVATSPDILPNTRLYAQQFFQQGILYRQYLYPTPADWNALKKALQNSYEQVNISTEGVISVRNGEQLTQGIMAYAISSGIENNKGQLYFDAIGDQNQDGIDDFAVVYSNGDTQIIYIIP